MINKIKGLLISKPTYIVVAVIVASASAWWANNEYKLYKLTQMEKQKEYNDAQVNVIIKQTEVAKKISKREIELTRKYQEARENIKLKFEEAKGDDNQDYTILSDGNTTPRL